MLDDVHHSRVLPDTAHADSMGIVAPQVLHENVGCIGLGREAIIANVDPGIRNPQPVDIKRVKAVTVFRLSLFDQLVHMKS
jgi:hypothetical protein